MQVTKNITERARRMDGVEGATTRRIERVTAAIPSSTWLLLAGGAILASLALKASGRHTTANFVGEWVPSLLMIGLYNKIVKAIGSDRMESGLGRA